MKLKLDFLKKLCFLIGVNLSCFLVSEAQVCTQTDVNTFQASVSQPASCLSNGAIQTSVTNSNNVRLKFMSTPPGTTLTGVYNVGSIGSLKAGSYTIRAYCINDENVNKDITINIPDEYVPITASTDVVSLCANGAPDATITVTATGGSGTLSYAYWQGVSNALDNTLTYTSSNTFNPTAYGVYNVRVKDACGEAVTLQASVVNPYPSNLQLTWLYPWTFGNSLDCTDTSYAMYVELKSNGVIVKKDGLPSSGVLFQIYEGECNSQNLVHLPFYDSVLSPISESDDILVPANKKIVIKAITPCGDTTSFCYDGTVQGQPSVVDIYRQSSCESGVGGKITGYFSLNRFSTNQYSYTLTDSTTGLLIASGTNVTGEATVPNLQYGATYIFSVTDDCGRQFSVKRKMQEEASGTGNGITATVAETSLECTNQSGRLNADVTISGYVPGVDGANTRIRIIGPESINNVAERWFNPDFYRFFNVLPGTTYTAVIEKINSNISTGGVCENDTITFTTPTWGQVLQQTVSGTVAQNCSGGGDITLNTAYTGWNNSFVRLKNAVTGDQIGANSGGGLVTYSNVAPGRYVGELLVISSCPNSPDTLIISSDTLVLVGAGAGPQINRKIGVICEQGNGVPLSTGNAFFSFTGVAPFIVEYKKQSAANFTVFDLAFSGSEINLSNLDANEIYSIKITDACGFITNDNVEILVMEPVSIVSTAQPCIGSTYTISVPDYGNATYTWYKNNVQIATTREYVIPTFGVADAGEYRCEIVIANCLQRTATVHLYSQMCGVPVTNYLISGNVFNDSNGLVDQKVNGTPTNISGSLFAVLLDENNKVLGSVAIAADGTYDFSNVPSGSYKVLLNNGQPLDGTFHTASTLPTEWVNTGENHGIPTQNGNDGTINGIISIAVTNSNVTNVNFGIERRPESIDKLKTVPGSPVIGSPVNLGDVSMAGSDPEDQPSIINWNFKNLVITTLPTNNFILKYQGVVMQAGDTIFNYNPSLLTIEPSASTPDGTISTIFKYATLDAAFVIDNTPANYEVIWENPLPIFFNRFVVDANRCKNNLVWSVAGDLKELVSIQVEKLDHRGSFVTIATIKSGNNFVDDALSDGINSYRLKANGVSGEVVFSEVIKVHNKCATDQVSVFPNPANSQVYIKLPNVENATSFVIYNVLGAKVRSGNITTQTKIVAIDDLPNGQYVVEVHHLGRVSIHKVNILH